MTEPTTRTCFVIAPIGDPDSDVRVRSDQILNHVIAPAVERCGYDKPVRADEIDEPGDITSQVIQHVTEDDLVIADLTDRNPNVFYELAVRHAIRRPFIHIAQAGERIPFDVSGQRTIFIDHKDLDNVARAIESMTEQIRSFDVKDAQVETPISMSIDFSHLRRSENPEQRSLADILSELSSIRSTLSDMDLQRLEMSFESIRHEIEMNATRGRRRPGPPASYVLQVARAHFGTNPIGLPIALSLIRDEAPWLHEVGMETYRLHALGDTDRAQTLAVRLLGMMNATADLLRQGAGRQDALDQVRGMIGEIATGDVGDLPFE